MKIVLVGINSKFIHSNLAIRYLKAFTKDLDYNCTLREFSINDRIEKILKEIIEEKADVVAFSTYIWNVDYVDKLSNLIKAVNPEIKILYGGPEVSYDGQLYLKESVGDYVILGEGEKTYREFVEYQLGKKDIKEIKGIYYKEQDNIMFNGNRPLMDMNELVFPYEEEDNLDNKIVYYEASRGCPFNCKYCLSSTTHGVRFLDIERVKRELQYFIDKKVRLIKFVDRTFNCNHNFSKAIWNFLIENGQDTCFHFEISADILREDELEVLRKAPKGMFQFEVGVQTTNDTVLNNINRFVNFSHIKEKVEELEKIRNIKQHLDLIAGLPGEDYKSFKKSFNDVHSIEPEEIQLGFLKLLKGSSMREEAEKWGMVYSPYPPYEILKTKDISYEEILELKKVEEIVDKYYNSQKFNNVLNYFLPKFKTPFDFYHGLGSFFERKGYFNRNLSNVDYYKVFVEFNEEVLNEDSKVLKEIIKYDYLCFNKKKWLPDFLNRDITKEEEREIKLKLKEKYNTKKIHIEKFDIDIISYIENRNTILDKSFVIFDELKENNILCNFKEVENL